MDREKTAPIIWSTTIWMAVFHVMAVVALFYFSWTNLLVMLGMLFISGSLGIGVGYHRLLTHRGFVAPRWLERTLAFLGTLALQSGPITWVTTHRLHHAFTETDKDPHSPAFGTMWAHIGWMLRGTAQNNPPEVVRKYSPDLVRDPFLVTLDRFHWVPTLVLGIALGFIGGFGMLLWGVFFRVVFGWHCTWLVNSATHLWGSRRFETRDTSRNNGLIAAITWGEGWHNNHHAFPRSARHGLAWYEFDINWIVIRVLETFGLIKDVYQYKIKDKVQEAIDLEAAAQENAA